MLHVRLGSSFRGKLHEREKKRPRLILSGPDCRRRYQNGISSRTVTTHHIHVPNIFRSSESSSSTFNFCSFQVQPKTGKTRLVFVRKTHGKPAAIGRQLANFTLHAQT